MSDLSPIPGHSKICTTNLGGVDVSSSIGASEGKSFLLPQASTAAAPDRSISKKQKDLSFLLIL